MNHPLVAKRFSYPEVGERQMVRQANGKDAHHWQLGNAAELMLHWVKGS